MSEHADAGSVVADAPPAGTPANAQTPPANGSAAGADNPFSGLSEGTRKWVETKGYKSIEDLATQGMNAEQKLGSMVSLPAEDAPQEEWDKVLTKLPSTMRRPESPDKYELKRPDSLPSDLPYDDALAKDFKGKAFELGATQKQADQLHAWFAGQMVSKYKMEQAKIAKSIEATHDDLVKAWGGPPDSEPFRAKHEAANRSIKKLGLVEAFKQSGILLPDGTLTNAQIAKAFAAVGERLFREDTIDHGSVPGGVNPWKDETKNVTQQMHIRKNDPTQARRLMREAGKDPSKVGL